MHGVISTCLSILATLAFTITVTAAPQTVSLQTFRSYQQKYAVVISTSGTNYCSGTITTIGIVTAAHCCPPSDEPVKTVSYSKDGINYSPISAVTIDANGTDMCVMTPKHMEYSHISIGHYERNETGRVIKSDYINISKISLVHSRQDLEKHEVQNVDRIAMDDEDTRVDLFQGYGMPGMSGSAILNWKGQLVGVIVLGKFRDARKDFVPNLFGVAPIDLSQWGHRVQ